MRYCMDSIPEPSPDDPVMRTAMRGSFETVITCSPCHLTGVCRACAQQCHRTHDIDVNFVRWTPRKDICGCFLSGKCKAAWSREREIFDRISDLTNTPPPAESSIALSDFRRVLAAMHSDLTDEDYDAGEVALKNPSNRITWFQFEHWHTPYFQDKDNDL